MEEIRLRVPSPRIESVDFCRHYEVALGESVDFVRPESDLGLTPGQQNIGMMSLLLGDRTDPIHEVQSLLEIREGKRANNMMLIDYIPMSPLRNLLVNLGEFFASERRNPAATRNTGFGS
jgi:hypothetical protein